MNPTPLVIANRRLKWSTNSPMHWDQVGSVSATIFTAFGSPKNKVFPKKATNLRQCPSFFGKKRSKKCPQNEANLAWSRWLWELERLQWFLLCFLGHMFFAGDQLKTQRGILNAIFCRDLFQASGWFLCIQRFPCQLPGETIGVVNMASIFLVQSPFGEYDCCQKTLGTPKNNTNLPTNQSPKLQKTHKNTISNPTKQQVCQDWHEG